MKFLRLDLLTLLISLFILGSCKNTDTVGLPVNNEDQVTGTQLVSNDITVKTERVDSVLTTALAKTPLAYFKDPALGTTEANLVSGISLPLSSAYTKPTGTITTDSAVLVLRYADGFYGDSLNSNYRVNVYQLGELPSPSQSYYSNKTWKFNTPVVGGRAFKPYTHTTISITDIVAGKADTLKRVPAQLRVPLSTSFIDNNFWNASATQLANNPTFQAAIRGLYLKLDQNQNGVGGNIMFNMDSSRVDVYYRNVGTSSTDTAIVSLPLVNHSAEIRHTYSTAVSNAISSTATNPIFYLQGLAGLKARIVFPGLNTLFGNVNANNIILNRAELIITPNPGSTIPYVPQPKLSMYRNDLAKQPTLLPDASSTSKYYLSTGIFGGGYSSTLSSYRFVVTGYLQELLRGTLTDYGTYITAVDTTNVSTTSINYLPSSTTAGRTIAVGTDKTSGYGIKLNIFYTKTNQ